jgi:hypothetical protein
LLSMPLCNGSVPLTVVMKEGPKDLPVGHHGEYDER